MAWKGKGGDSAGCSINRVRLENTTEPQARKLLIPKVLVAYLYLAPCNPVDCSPPGFSVHGISQAKILEWIAISFSRGIFLTQRSNPGFLHYRWVFYQLSDQRRPVVLLLIIK